MLLVFKSQRREQEGEPADVARARDHDTRKNSQRADLFFCLIILAYSLSRLWRRTFYPSPVCCPRGGGTLQAPLCPPPGPVPKEREGKWRTKERNVKKREPSPTPRLRMPCKGAWVGTVVAPPRYPILPRRTAPPPPPISPLPTPGAPGAPILTPRSLRPPQPALSFPPP